MDMIWLTLLVGIHLLATVTAEYYIHNETLTWSNASEMCRLARPNISFTKYNETLDVGTDTITENTWIGYVAKPIVLKYIGCYRKKGLPQDVQKYTTRLRVNVCFSACGTTYIGIGGDGTCLCINRTDGLFQDSWSLCNKNCDNLACGSDNLNFISVYTNDSANEVTHRRTDEKPICTTLSNENSGLVLGTRQCNNRTSIGGILCPVYVERKIMYYVHEKDMKTWSELILECNSASEKTHDNITMALIGIKTSKEVWTTSFSVFYLNIGNAYIYDSMSIQPYRYGYVDETHKLKFGDGQSSFKALCQQGVYVGVGIGCAVIGTLVGVSVVFHKEIYRKSLFRLELETPHLKDEQSGESQIGDDNTAAQHNITVSTLEATPIKCETSC